MLSVMAAFSIAAYADAEPDWYSNNAYLLSTNNIVKSALRSIAWGITKVLLYLSEAVGHLYDATFSLIDFTRYGEINDILTRLQPVLAALIVASLIFYGITMMVQRQKNQNLVRNLILGMIAVSCSLFAFNLLNNMAIGFKDGILGKAGDPKQCYALVNANAYDLVNIDKKLNINNLNYSKGLDEGCTGANIRDMNSVNLLDINETMNYSDPSEGQDLYGWSPSLNEKIGQRITVVDGQELKLKEVYNGVFTTTIGNEFYYRYTVNWIACWLQLFSYLIMIIALSYKNVRLVYELVNARILAFLHAADITSGERLKQIFLFIRDTYICLGISVLSVKLFSVFSTYAAERINYGAFHGIAGAILQGLISLFIAFVVIDGPNIAERLLGMDAGLSRSWARTMGALEIGRRIANGVGGHGSAVKKSGGDSSDAVEGVHASDNKNRNKGSKAAENMDAAMKDKLKAEGEGKKGGGPEALKPDAEGKGQGAVEAMNEAQAQKNTGETGAESGGGTEPVSAGVPDFMDNRASEGQAAGPANSGTKEESSSDRMHVDFMEKGSGAVRPITDRTETKKPHIETDIKIPPSASKQTPVKMDIQRPGEAPKVGSDKTKSTAPKPKNDGGRNDNDSSNNSGSKG